MRVEVNAARTVTLTLSHIDGGSATQTYHCTGAPAFEGYQVGIGSYGGGRIDNLSTASAFPGSLENFNWQDGPLGSDWRMRNGSISVRSGIAAGALSDNTPSLATYNGLGSNRVEGDISLTPGGGAQYAGFVLSYDEGVNDLFLKVQDNDGNGNFERAFCYTGNNNFSGHFGPVDGYIPLSTPFSTAHMKVEVDATRTVTISFSNIDGGGGSQAYTCAGAPPAEGNGVGIASYGGGRIDNFQVITNFQDNFSRANGALGSNWNVRNGAFNIVSQVARGSGGYALATYTGLGANAIEGDISLAPGGGTQYSGFVLNYGAGVNDIFLKAQDDDGNGDFDKFACYKGNNGLAFGPGIFSLSAPFTTAHLYVSVDAARNVTIVLSRINGGTGVQIYTCAGAPAAEGDQVGIVGYEGGQIDNVRVNRTIALDQFNHSDGALGPVWSLRANNYTVVSQRALGGMNPTNWGLASFNNITSSSIEGDVSLNPGGGVQYAGFALNYRPGVNFVFVKLQDSNGNGDMEDGACYIGNNSGPFGLGYFSLSAPVITAHLRVAVDANRNVWILLTKINGGTGAQTYVCNGAPVAQGNGVGMVGYGGGRLDNVLVSDYNLTGMIFLPYVRR